MKKRLQDPPNAVQIELVEGCQLRCSFCGLSGIRKPKEHDYKCMRIETLESLIKQMADLGWNPRIEFAMHGEPTMHPICHEMILAARTIAPRWHMMMTSNGGGLLRSPGPVQRVEALFKSGLNVLALDDYEGANIVGKIRDAINGKLAGRESDWVQIREYPADPLGNPHRRLKPGEMMLTYIQDIGKAQKGTHSVLNNHAGAGAPLNESGAGKRCAKPFREMSIRWDGNVAVCCNDWRGVYKCGNIAVEGVKGIWYGKPMEAAREMLYRGRREFAPCKGCDAISYRVGLLPDKYGKEEMRRPDKQTKNDIATAIAGAPYTAPVLREWET